MPLSALDELLSFALKEEERIERNDTIKELLPLWIAGHAISRLKNEDFISFEDFIQQTIPGEASPKTEPKRKRTAEEIMAEFEGIIEADRKRGAR